MKLVTHEEMMKDERFRELLNHKIPEIQSFLEVLEEHGITDMYPFKSTVSVLAILQMVLIYRQIDENVDESRLISAMEKVTKIVLNAANIDYPETINYSTLRLMFEKLTLEIDPTDNEKIYHLAHLGTMCGCYNFISMGELVPEGFYTEMINQIYHYTDLLTDLVEQYEVSKSQRTGKN